MFSVDGYKIPVELVMLTGGGTDDWKSISNHHLDMYRKYTPICHGDSIVEIGCGVGRDAITLTKVLSSEGKYLGIDIIKPSIDWCSKNITKKHKNFKFKYYDIKSQIHNNNGKIKTTDIKLPITDNSVDKIFLHSVFTHMFEKDIIHYMKEFRRVLKSDGLVLASFFVLDKKALMAAHKGKGEKNRHPLTFEFKYYNGCYINNKQYPEGAIGYTPNKLKSMILKSGLAIHGRHIHRGGWFGIKEASCGQDVIILEKSSLIESAAQLSRSLKFTNR